jgi:hypothetical protein
MQIKRLIARLATVLSSAAVASGAAVLVFCGTSAQAQYLGFNAIGDYGLKSGSQPAPGIYALAPSLYRVGYDGLRNANGEKVATNIDVNMTFLITGAQVTTDKKILGATYGFQVLPIFINNQLTVARPDVAKGTGMGWGDMYFQPINLGWRKKKADFLAAYGIWAPSGTQGRTLHYWGHELVGGTTVYLDEQQKWHVAGTAFFDMHQTRNDTDIKVGNYLTLEGGAGRSFLKGAGKAGLAYAMQWKVSDDSGTGVPALARGNKNRVFGLGPSITMPVFAKGTVVGLVNASYLWEFGARTNFEGDVFIIGFTIAKLKSLP